jgi:hypothetical protein
MAALILTPFGLEVNDTDKIKKKIRVTVTTVPVTPIILNYGTVGGVEGSHNTGRGAMHWLDEFDELGEADSADYV